jgi:LysR family hydrogen peroxide-inducible transcriptional activator
MTTLTSLKQLHYLVALADELNFTRAAAACAVTQSTLSAGLKELERLLGVALVERDRQRVLLTPVGAEVARRARLMLAEAKDLVAIAAGATTPMTGLLRLGVIPTVAPFLLPDVLRLLRKRYPALRLALREDVTPALLSRLDSGEIDFALIALPYETGNLLLAPLFEDELWIVGPSEDPALQGRVVSITPSLAERLLLLEEGHCLRDHTLYACPAAARAARHGMEATSLLTLVQMIESRIGLGLVPAMAVRRGLVKSPGLAARPIARPKPKRTIALVARRSTSRRADFQALAEAARKAGR